MVELAIGGIAFFCLAGGLWFAWPRGRHPKTGFSDDTEAGFSGEGDNTTSFNFSDYSVESGGSDSSESSSGSDSGTTTSDS